MKWINEAELERGDRTNLPEWRQPVVTVLEVESVTALADGGGGEVDGTTHS